jgi:16S rRNA (guanine527-N7)-methyltransferase
MYDREQLLAVHRELLEQWRTRMNLVGPGPIDVHYTDAERALAGRELTGHWADLGTGAGFPGIVLAARHPRVRLDLVDSRRKRCVFLEECVHRSGATGLEVRCTRVETLPDAHYDGVVSRAFAPPPAVFEHARRLLKPGGQIGFFLQDDTRLPAAEDFEHVAETPYVVDGKSRRSVWLRLR